MVTADRECGRAHSLQPSSWGLCVSHGRVALTCLLLCRAAELFGRAGSMLKDAGSSVAGATVSMAHQAQAAAAKARAVQVSRSHVSVPGPSIPAT